MSKYDISKYSIRVILNADIYHPGSVETPLNVEGTVLSIDTVSGSVINMIKKHELLDILCNSGIGLFDTVVRVRWDNDTKQTYPAGSFIFRAGKVSICNNIWERKRTINISNVPFHTLKPVTYKHPKPLRFMNNKQPKQMFIDDFSKEWSITDVSYISSTSTKLDSNVYTIALDEPIHGKITPPAYDDSKLAGYRQNCGEGQRSEESRCDPSDERAYPLHKQSKPRHSYVCSGSGRCHIIIDDLEA